MNEKKATPINEAALKDLQSESKTCDNSNDAAAQRGRALDALRIEPKDTIQLRRDYDILSPAARIWELKHRFGFEITKLMVRRHTECGKLHRVALYVLMRETGGHA